MDSPNVALFMVDHLSAKWVEKSEEGVYDLPNIHRLNTRGVSFTQAFVTNPVCFASRGPIATGLTTRGHAVLENGYQLRLNCKPLCRCFNKMAGVPVPLVRSTFNPITADSDRTTNPMDLTRRTSQNISANGHELCARANIGIPTTRTVMVSNSLTFSKIRMNSIT